MGEKVSGIETVHSIISALKSSGIFSNLEVLELIDEESVKALKVKATVSDGSVLYITEMHAAEAQKYSYHWQDCKGSLIVRWDNAPHWKKLPTFPYHRHEKGNVYSSQRADISDVIQEIKKRIRR